MIIKHVQSERRTCMQHLIRATTYNLDSRGCTWLFKCHKFWPLFCWISEVTRTRNSMHWFVVSLQLASGFMLRRNNPFVDSTKQLVLQPLKEINKVYLLFFYSFLLFLLIFLLFSFFLGSVILMASSWAHGTFGFHPFIQDSVWGCHSPPELKHSSRMLEGDSPGGKTWHIMGIKFSSFQQLLMLSVVR